MNKTNNSCRYLIAITTALAFVFQMSAINESPYALFGDSTLILGIENITDSPNWQQSILTEDSTLLFAYIVNDKIYIKDESQKIIASANTVPYGRAMFTGIDPAADEMPWVSPFTFCFANPIRYTDTDGERPSPYEAALMASVVYNDKFYNTNLKELGKHYWHISSFPTTIMMEHPAKTGIGIQSLLFERTINGITEYAYAYAGTNCWEDIVEDATQIFGISTQYYRAYKNAISLSQELLGHELTFVGHSLGGGLAALSSMATGWAAITFNPAVVSMMTRLFYGLKSNGNITNYITGYSFLGFSFIRDPITILQREIGLYAPGVTKVLPMTFQLSHTIDRFVNYLE